MPKVGRKNERCPVMQDSYGVIRNAPYGNTLSDVERVKIVGGRSVAIREDDRWPQKCANSLKVASLPLLNAEYYSPSPLHNPILPSPRLLDYPPHSQEYMPRPLDFNFRRTDVPPSPSEGVQSYASPRALQRIDGRLANVPTPQAKQQIQPETRINPLPVIPPISTKNDEDTPEDIQLSRRDELNLRIRIANGLNEDFDCKRLKEAYCELSNIDTSLSGFIDYSSLGYALARSRIDISLNDLHQMSTIFTNPRDGRQVAYEKVLSFIAAAHAIHKKSYAEKMQTTPIATTSRSLQSTAMSERQDGFSTGRNDTKLQLTIDNDITRIFLQADVKHTNIMTSEQIRTLTYAAGMEVKEDDIDDALRISKINPEDKIHNWKIYLETVRNMPKRESPMRQIEVKKIKLSAVDIKNAEGETIRRDAWFKRFMKMAKALYSNDTNSSGMLSLKETQWLVKEYNDVYTLGMQWNLLEDILNSLTFINSESTQMVRIDQLLRSLIRLVN